MSELPKNPSESFRKLNPHLFGGAPERPESNGALVMPPPYWPQGDDGRRQSFSIKCDPVPAPRMTQRDRWKKRPCVERYFDFKTTIQKEVGDIPTVPDEIVVIFYFPMPESWSNKKRLMNVGKPHRQRPDGDNCLKALQDALFLEDGTVWRATFEKRWHLKGAIELEMIWREP